MADEHYEKRIEKLTDMHIGENANFGEPLETRIKQEGILQRLKLPIDHLLRYTAIAIRSMVMERRDED